jgi:hypothetical protein
MNILNSVFAMKMLHRGQKTKEQSEAARSELLETLKYAMEANKQEKQSKESWNVM